MRRLGEMVGNAVAAFLLCALLCLALAVLVWTMGLLADALAGAASVVAAAV